MLILKTALLAAATYVLADSEAQRRAKGEHGGFEIRGVDPVCKSLLLPSTSLPMTKSLPCISDVEVSIKCGGILLLPLRPIHQGIILGDQRRLL